MLSAVIGNFFEKAKIWDSAVENAIPIAHAIRMDLGAGKSTEARSQAVEFLTGLRARGNKRAVVFAVPALKLGREQALEFNKKSHGFTAETWHGRRADDPDAPGNTMCQNLGALKLLRRSRPR